MVREDNAQTTGSYVDFTVLATEEGLKQNEISLQLELVPRSPEFVDVVVNCVHKPVRIPFLDSSGMHSRICGRGYPQLCYGHCVREFREVRTSCFEELTFSDVSTAVPMPKPSGLVIPWSSGQAWNRSRTPNDSANRSSSSVMRIDIGGKSERVEGSARNRV